MWFIVETSASDLEQVSNSFETRQLKTCVAATFALEEAQAAYDPGNSRSGGRGKVVMTVK